MHRGAPHRRLAQGPQKARHGAGPLHVAVNTPDTAHTTNCSFNGYFNSSFGINYSQVHLSLSLPPSLSLPLSLWLTLIHSFIHSFVLSLSLSFSKENKCHMTKVKLNKQKQKENISVAPKCVKSYLSVTHTISDCCP